MKIKKIIILLLVGLCTYSYCQSDFQNLDKYWFYRDRLKKFVLVSSNYNEQGTNYPAAKIYNDSLCYDDGNGVFNHYVSVLATEYRLLKNNGQDYSNTIKELYYALKSFERIDRIAETYSGGAPALNGSYLRQDVDQAFWQKYKAGGTNPYFTVNNLSAGVSPYAGDTPENKEYELNSLDNNVHNLYAFYLVYKLVDNEIVDGNTINFKDLVKSNVLRIMTHMYHPNDTYVMHWCDYDQNILKVFVCDEIKNVWNTSWYLKNTVTNQLVPEGNGTDGTMLALSKGFAAVANAILGVSSYTGTLYSSNVTDLLLSSSTNTVPLTLTFDIKNATGAYYPCGKNNAAKIACATTFTCCPIPIATPIVFGTMKVTLGNLVLFNKYKPAGTTGEYDFVNLLTANYNPYTYTYDFEKQGIMCALGNITASGVSKNAYQILMERQKNTPLQRYEDLALLWSIIQNNYSYISSTDRSFVKDLLNRAPQNGPYKSISNGILQYGDFEWSGISRLVWPEHLGDRKSDEAHLGEFTGLDYMLLHNLYWLTNKNKTGDAIDANITYRKVSTRSLSIINSLISY
jgi:hypothetical protein